MKDSYYVGIGEEPSKDWREKRKMLTDKEMILFKLNLTMPCFNCGKVNKFECEEDVYICFCNNHKEMCDSVMIVSKDDKGKWRVEYV